MLTCAPKDCKAFTLRSSDHGGADVVQEVAGAKDTFRLAWDCAEILELIEAGKIDTTPLITHHYKLEDIGEAYRVFENKLDGVIQIAVTQERGEFNGI